jgi:5-bromo-4-chloroindolyl phosphate hydrolysis protein
MKIKVTRSQYKALEALSRKDINTIRKNPSIVSAARDMLKACRKVLKRVEGISDHASRRKRRTAYKKIAALCEKAIAKAEGKQS